MPKGRRTKEQALRYCKKTGRKIIWLQEKDDWRCATDISNTPHFALEVYEAATGNQFISWDGHWVPKR